MAPSESAPPINPRTLSGLRQLLVAELRGLIRTCFGAFWRATLICAAPGFLYCIFAFLRGLLRQDRQEPLELDVLVIGFFVYMGMSLVYGAYGGLVAAVVAGLWRLFGGWMFLPVGVTLAVFLGLGWLFEGVVTHQMEDLRAALVVSGHQHGFPNTLSVLSGPGAAHAGGPMAAVLLLILLPFLLADAIIILMDPSVLWQLALLAMLVGGLFVLATVLTLAISLPVLGWSLVKRVRARHQFVSSASLPL